MHSLIYWFGFGGAWLLVIGPVFQSAVEMAAEEETSARLRGLTDGEEAPPPVSLWWWLLPPVRFVLVSRRRRVIRDRALVSLSREELEDLTRYVDVARGWMYVGAGAWLIALKETYELVEHSEWSLVVYWLLVLGMSLFALSFSHPGVRRGEGHRREGRRGGARRRP